MTRFITTTLKANPMAPPVLDEKTGKPKRDEKTGELIPPTSFGKVFIHVQQLPNGEVVGVSFSTQGTKDDTAMGQFLRSISESLEGSA
jgi:hypothetical protein